MNNHKKNSDEPTCGEKKLDSYDYKDIKKHMFRYDVVCNKVPDKKGDQGESQ